MCAGDGTELSSTSAVSSMRWAPTASTCHRSSCSPWRSRPCRSRLSCLEAAAARLERPPRSLISGGLVGKLHDTRTQDDGCDSDTSSEGSWASDEDVPDRKGRSSFWPSRDADPSWLPLEARNSFAAQPREAWKKTETNLNSILNDVYRPVVCPAALQDSYQNSGEVAGELDDVESSSMGVSATSVDVDFIVPNGVSEGHLLSADYEGLHYQVTAPPGCRPGSIFRRALLQSPQ